MKMARGVVAGFALPLRDSRGIAGRALEVEQPGCRGEIEIQGEDRVA